MCIRNPVHWSYRTCDHLFTDPRRLHFKPLRLNFDLFMLPCQEFSPCLILNFSDDEVQFTILALNGLFKSSCFSASVEVTAFILLCLTFTDYHLENFARKRVSKAVLRIRDVYPGSDFFPSRKPDPHKKMLKKKKIISKLSEIWSGLFIPDPDSRSGSWFFTHPGSRIQVSKRHRIPDPDPQHWSKVRSFAERTVVTPY